MDPTQLPDSGRTSCYCRKTVVIACCFSGRVPRWQSFPLPHLGQQAFHRVWLRGIGNCTTCSRSTVHMSGSAYPGRHCRHRGPGPSPAECRPVPRPSGNRVTVATVSHDETRWPPSEPASRSGGRGYPDELHLAARGHAQLVCSQNPVRRSKADLLKASPRPPFAGCQGPGIRPHVHRAEPLQPQAGQQHPVGLPTAPMLPSRSLA